MKYFTKTAETDWRNPTAAGFAGLAGYLGTKDKIVELQNQKVFIESAKGPLTLKAMLSGKAKDAKRLGELANKSKMLSRKVLGLRTVPLLAAGGVYAAGKGYEKLMDKLK